MKTEQHSGGKHSQRFDCQFHSQIYEKLKKKKRPFQRPLVETPVT